MFVDDLAIQLERVRGTRGGKARIEKREKGEERRKKFLVR